MPVVTACPFAKADDEMGVAREFLERIKDLVYVLSGFRKKSGRKENTGGVGVGRVQFGGIRRPVALGFVWRIRARIAESLAESAALREPAARVAGKRCI